MVLRGDIYLEIEILPDPMFTLTGRDIYLTVPVTPWEAALGQRLTFPRWAVKLGSNSQRARGRGKSCELKGRGMPGKPHPGDQYAIVQIDTPPAHTAEQKQFYEKMAQLMPFISTKGLARIDLW